MPTTLSCRCGAVAIELGAEPMVQFFCHCDDCQVVHGAAYVPESVYPAEAVRVVEGSPATWTLKRNPRSFCGACGTRLFIEVAPLKVRGVSGTLLPAGAFRPSFHMHCQFAIAPVMDGLPHYKGRPPQFGGLDERVDW